MDEVLPSVDEYRNFGPQGRDTFGCNPGFRFDGCRLLLLGGSGGLASIDEEDPSNCTCRVYVFNDGAVVPVTYQVQLYQVRDCD